MRECLSILESDFQSEWSTERAYDFNGKKLVFYLNGF